MKIIVTTLMLFTVALFGTTLYLHSSVSDEPLNQWDGDEYLENAQLQAGWADKFFFQKCQFKGNEFVLDIGSGDGRLTARIADKVPNGYVVGIDNSDSMIQVALRNWGDIDNLAFQLQDAEEELFYKNYHQKFDLVVSFTALHWMQNQRLVLNGLHDVLKPHGSYYIRLASKGGDPVQDLADVMIASRPYQPYFTHFVDPMSRFSCAEYRMLLDLAGLRVDSLLDVEEQDEIEGRANLSRQLKSWLPHYHFLKQKDEALSEAFMEELVDRYLELYPPTANGKIVLYDHYLEVSGAKSI